MSAGLYTGNAPEFGYIIGHHRDHLPESFKGIPSREPGFGEDQRTLCGMLRGIVYAESFHRKPLCQRCETYFVERL